MDDYQEQNIDSSITESQIGQARNLQQWQFIYRGGNPLRLISRWRRPNPQQSNRDRQALLDKVRNYWVKSVLHELLYEKVLINLVLEERFDTLRHPWGVLWETPEQLKQPLPLETKIIDIFDQMGEGATLLILGEPNSGKTTVLLQLALDLLNVAELNSSYPMPVVLEASSWTREDKTIPNWIIRELRKRYQISEELSKIWIRDQQFLLVLDSLDKVRINLRDSFVVALNQFIQRHGTTGIVISSRIAEYEELSKRLNFQKAICIKPSQIKNQ